MKTPAALVAAALVAAILLTASFLIATGTRGEGAASPIVSPPANAGEPLFQRRQY